MKPGTGVCAASLFSGGLLVCLAGIGCDRGTNLTGQLGDGSGEDVLADDASSDRVVDAPDDNAGMDDDAAPETIEEEALSWDFGPPRDAVEYDADAVPPIVEVPGCGNGVLDPGEECDDRNRLNGDGCDWLCRLGDGEPPPAPDPDVGPFVPAGDLVMVDPDAENSPWSLIPMPLTWSGSAYATVTCANGDDSAGARFRFFRFDPAGRRFGSIWTYETSALCLGHDLVWTGSGYGLFFADAERGIFFLSLDVDGKPRGEPVLVEPDPQARGPAADATDDGFILAWTCGGEPGAWVLCGDWGWEADQSVRVRRVGRRGETTGAPVIVAEDSAGTADIAAGEGGFGLSIWVGNSDETPSCAQRFAWLSEDFARVVPSGVLSPGVTADVKWAAGRYYTAWLHWDTMYGGDGGICVARFTPDGILERAPVCNAIADGEEMSLSAVRTAAGDEGLATVVTTNTNFDFFFLRTDLLGTAVAPPYEIFPCDSPRPDPRGCSAFFWTYNTVWADRGFGVIFTGELESDTYHAEGLFLQTFVAE